MPVQLQNDELSELMENFYVLTGIRMVLFDENYNEIISYPKNGTPFCSYMRQNAEFDCKCRLSDRTAFEKCRKSKDITVYKCHAGLIEATAPIMENGMIIGYIMFGQITDDKTKEELFGSFRDENIAHLIKKIKYKTKKQIYAASKILDACTGYILLKEMIKPSRRQLINNIEGFIESHIDEEISVQRLCREFSVSRTQLYEAVGKYINGGIAAHIREKRLLHAEKLVKNTDKSVSVISSESGFSDYNYFLRVFKKRFGISPKKMRNTVSKIM